MQLKTLIGQQPSSQVARIDWSNPITRGLTFATVGGNGVAYDIVKGKFATRTGAVTGTYNAGLSGQNYADSTQRDSFGTEYNKAGSRTIFAVAKVDSSSNITHIFGISNTTDTSYSPYVAGDISLLWFGAGGYYGSRVGTTSSHNLGYFSPSTLALADGNYRKMMVVVDSNRHDFYIDDAVGRMGSPGSSVLNVSTNDLHIGSSVESTAAARVNLALGLMWDRALTDNEAKSIIENPWQIFKSQSVKNRIQDLYKRVPAPNPTYRKQYAIGYHNSGTPSSEYSPTGGSVSGKYAGYSFSSTWYNSWSSPSSTVLTISPNAGDFVFLTIIGNNTNATTVVDNAGSTWTNILNADSDGSYGYSFWYCNNINSGSTSITATFTGGYPTTVKMVAAAYRNMTGTVLQNYAPRLSQVNPGTELNAIRSNTSFNNVSSNTTGFTVTTDNALFIGITHQLGGSATYTAGDRFKLRRNYYGILHQDAYFNNIANSASIITCSDTAGAASTYATYGFAFSQPVIQNSIYYTAKAGDVITTFRFKGRATYAAQTSYPVIGVYRVDTGEIIHSKEIKVIYNSSPHQLYEIPVAWHLTAGLTYSLFIYSVDGSAIVSFDNSYTKFGNYGESGYGGSQYQVGSIFTIGYIGGGFGGFGDNYRFIISGDVTNTYGIKYKDSKTFYPVSATAVSPPIKVQRGDKVLVRAVWAGGNPISRTITDNLGNYYNTEYNTGEGTNGVNQEGSMPHYHYSWDMTPLISSDNLQFTITNTGGITPYLIQYSVYSSPFNILNGVAYRGITYSVGGSGNSEAYTYDTDRPFVTVVMGDSGNTSPTSGDYIYPQANSVYSVRRTSEPGINTVTPATLIYEINSPFSANSTILGSSGLYTSLGSGNGKTACFSRHWQLLIEDNDYRQAAAREDGGTLKFAVATKPRSLVMVFVQGVGNDITVSDDKGTVYKSVNVGKYSWTTYPTQRFFYGYPQAGMTTITIVGGNSTSYAVEEPEMELVATSSSTGAIDYIATKYSESQYFPWTWSANTSAPDVGYIFLGQTESLARPGVKSIGDILWSPLVGSGIDPVTGERINVSYGASTQLLRARLPQSCNAIATLATTPELQVAGEHRFMIFLKKPQLMLGPDVTKWDLPYYPNGYVAGPGRTCTWYMFGYIARFSGYTTSVNFIGTGGNSNYYLAIYDEDGVYLGRTIGTPTTNSGYKVSNPINVYLEQGKRYYIAFLNNESYFTMYGNRNGGSYRMSRYSPTDWAYNSTTPPANLVTTYSDGINEVAMWVEGIPSTIKHYANGILDSGTLIENY